MDSQSPFPELAPTGFTRTLSRILAASAWPVAALAMVLLTRGWALLDMSWDGLSSPQEEDGKCCPRECLAVVGARRPAAMPPLPSSRATP